MFENFGVLDILDKIKKNRIKFVLVILIFSSLFIAKFILTINKNTIDPIDHIYISSADYYVEPDEYVISGNNNNYELVSNSYVALLKSDLCKKYIFDNLMSKFSEDYILNQSELKAKKDHFGENLMSELYYVKRLSGSNLIEISSMTYSKELSDYIRDICLDFMSNIAGKRITNSSIKLSGKLERDIKKSDLFYENIDRDDKRLIVKPVFQSEPSLANRIIKKVISPIILIVVLCILVIVIMGMLNPTINRPSDFLQYDIPVIENVENLSKLKENE